MNISEVNQIEWKCLKKYPLNNDCVCLVMNSKGWMRDAKAIYYKDYDVFVLYNANSIDKYTLEVTHYIVIPTFEEWKLNAIP